MIFMSVEVIKTRENTFYIEWDMREDNPPETIDDWKFQIWFSTDPVSLFESIKYENSYPHPDGDPVEIDGAVGPLSYTHLRKQYDFNTDHYYKIKAILKSDENINFFSEVRRIGMNFDGAHDTMRYVEEVLYDMYYGEPCYVVKVKGTGVRCTKCWSEARQQRIISHCDVCNGSGFVTGYYSPIPIQISFDSDPKKNDVQKEWENVFDTKRARMSNYPIVKPKDYIINKDEYKRYVITHVETTKLPMLASDPVIYSKQNYIVSQLLILEEIVPDDNQYNIPLP